MNKPYIIFAPSFVKNSGGILVLHKLCHILNQLGENAYIYHHDIDRKNYYQTNSSYFTPIADESVLRSDPIVIYSEIVNGNPLGSKNVVRWMKEKNNLDIYKSGQYNI